MDTLPEGRYGAILADPPWAFRTYSKTDIAPARGAQPYDVMSLADIKALPVGEVAAKDCLLFMWTVSHLQREAFDVAEAWGFRPVSVAFVWDKGRMGMGYWTRQEVEICHLFKRGKPRRQCKGVRSLIRSPRREHSRKPDEQYERIERLVDGPYLELFARQAWSGWTAWGNQVSKFEAANDNSLVQARVA
ncbi:MT-A70 family methyltransferase [Limoniibacter endophyticus]|uniref:Adenine methylase n=1 Tax=Limoniibacter endophyticus TaxID=1565040 RepID=A0A8J3GGP4_9HYPH|nr:MT-A70 family methyltransferase [Limoniibacter endophyticus]GHC61425.1 adenine methylase [Limoniibacter endophyticus]